MAKKGPIVIIEDDTEDEEIFKDILEELKISNKIIWFTDPHKAFDYLKTTSEQPFIIFSDINIPKQNAVDTKKVSFPKTVQPMLATLADEPPGEPGWMYEVKWDGYRAIALMNKERVNLISRNNKSFDEKFYPVHTALKSWKINAVVDGEVAV